MTTPTPTDPTPPAVDAVPLPGTPEYEELYQAALKQSSDLRRELKQKLLQLRAHEELMNTPRVKPGR